MQHPSIDIAKDARLRLDWEARCVTRMSLLERGLNSIAVLSLVVLACCASVSLAQKAAAPTPTPTPEEVTGPIRVKTDLVTLTLTVTDPYNRYVSGLTKNAFSIFDEGQEQEITYFSDTDAPISVGIVFDISGSMSGDKIRKAREALEKFISTSHPSDEYFLIAFNSRAQL